MLPGAASGETVAMVAEISHSPVPQAPHTAGSRPSRTPSAASQEAARHDARLVDRFKAGDETAFDELNARYRKKIAAYAVTILHSHADAEEVAQDTLIRAHRNLAAFRGECSLNRWMHAIALNLARNRYGYLVRRRTQVTQSLDCAMGDDSSATFAELAACDAPGPASEAITQDFTALVASCIKRLTPEHRDILDLRILRSAPYDEIAAAVGINVGTVKSRLARARAQLRDLMVGACPEFAPDAGSSAWFETTRPLGGMRIAG